MSVALSSPLAALALAPVPLAADNFTPLSRTPWAGRVIGEAYKRELVPGAAGRAVGESWEFSAGPELPSHIDLPGFEGSTLADLTAAAREAVLSPEVAGRGGAISLLVKLVDAASPLSMQVHPADDDPALKSSECGKPESWLVLEAAPGAGLYLGFARPLSREELRRALQSGAAAKELMHFEPVAPGDYFELEPGVPHAIGAGVTLLEPQRVLPGRAGKTYRLYDWGRRYDSEGRLDMDGGVGRELHIDQSLPLLDPENQVGAEYARSLRRRSRVLSDEGGVRHEIFAGNGYYQTHLLRLSAGVRAHWVIAGGYGALTVLAGSLLAKGISLAKGRSALLPHAAMPLPVEVREPSCCVVVVPAGATFAVSPA